MSRVLFQAVDSFTHDGYSVSGRVVVAQHLADQWARAGLGSVQRDRPIPLVVNGMHGMGDNLHQRSVMRELMKRYEVWLETPWPSIYHDMPDLHLITRGSTLRTQAKNAEREAHLYGNNRPPQGTQSLKVSYPPSAVRAHRSVLAAMSATVGVPVGDFRMPVPDEWGWIPGTPLSYAPLIIFRPLMERSEWTGCRNRNPDWMTYTNVLSMAMSAMPDAYVVSIADLEPGKEWLSGPEVTTDFTIHNGSLSFCQLAALWRRASLVISSPGFGIVLAQAVGTPSIVAFGGYEGNYSFSSGARYTPTHTVGLGCDCFSHHHACVKTDDGITGIAQFIKENCK